MAPLTHPHSVPHATTARAARIVGADEGDSVRAFGNDILFKLTAAHTGGTITLGLSSATPGHGPPPHVHSNEDEIFIIIEGTYHFYVDGTWTEAKAGSVAYLPRGTTHTFYVTGEAPGKHWVLLTPGGFEGFFSKCAEVFAAPGPPDMPALGAINAQYGMRILPPIGVPPSQSK